MLQAVDPSRAGGDPPGDENRRVDGPRAVDGPGTVEFGRVLEVGDREERRRARAAGPGVDERRLEDASVRPAAGDDDVVGPGPRPDLLDDRIDDRVGRDRARQALEDPGEALGLAAPADFEGPDGHPMPDGDEGDDDDDPDHQPVERPGAVDGHAQQRGQGEDEERTREDQP